MALAASWTRPFPAAWEVWQQPLCGTAQASQGPTVLRSGTLCLPGWVGVRALGLEVSVAPPRSQPMEERGTGQAEHLTKADAWQAHLSSGGQTQ